MFKAFHILIAIHLLTALSLTSCLSEKEPDENRIRREPARSSIGRGPATFVTLATTDEEAKLIRSLAQKINSLDVEGAMARISNREEKERLRLLLDNLNGLYSQSLLMLEAAEQASGVELETKHQELNQSIDDMQMSYEFIVANYEI